MKYKILLMYIGIISAVSIALYFSVDTNQLENIPKISSSNAQMPQDEIHKNLNKNALKVKPTKDNVSQSVVHNLEMMKKKLNENPSDTLTMRKYADLLTDSHKQNEALKYYEQILKTDPGRIDILFDLSYLHFNKFNYLKAEELTNEILKLDKNNLRAQYNLGAIYATRGFIKQAEKIWENLSKNYPNTQMASLANESLKKLNKK